MDSWLWTSSWGSPRLYVLIGIWIVSGMAALGVGVFGGGILFGILLWISISLGVVGRYESGYPPPVVLFLVCGILSGIIASLPMLKPAIIATRLYFSPPPLDDEDEGDDLAKEHPEPDEPGHRA